jgi:hypothetical protein
MESLNQLKIDTSILQLLATPEGTDYPDSAPIAYRFLAYYWGQRLERPLKSFDFLFQLLPA